LKKTLFFLFLYLCSCTTTPRCGDSIEARTIYIKKSSCEIRIRQVTIGSDLRIPESLKRPDLAGMELQWVEPGVIGGQVILGHFVFAPPSQIEGKTK
jgi:hypothetical protein